MFSGSIVAMVTPFKDGAVDFERLEELVEFHIQSGTHGIVPCGCTGEAATLHYDEQKEAIERVVKTVNGRVPIIAGTGSNSTHEALDLTSSAAKAGVDGALLITPYYNKPTQEGLYRHYKTLAEAVDIPIVLYNVPSRTGIWIEPETVARLSEIRNVVAVKEAGGSMDQVSKIMSLCDVTILSGDDSMTLPMMSVGAKGVISVVANVVPADTAAMTDAFLGGDHEKASALHHQLFPLCKAMFIETNPIPVKTAMKLLGRLNGELRMPLCEMAAANVEKLRAALVKYGLQPA